MPEKQYGYLRFLRLVFHTYPKRAILGATLMITQSFLYNAIFFTYALVLTQFYDVSATSVPLTAWPSPSATWPVRWRSARSSTPLAARR